MTDVCDTAREALRLAERCPPDWCDVIPAGDPATDPYGYGQLRTAPTEDGGGWSLLLKVDEYDEQDDVLRFCAFARNHIATLATAVLDGPRWCERPQKNSWWVKRVELSDGETLTTLIYCRGAWEEAGHGVRVMYFGPVPPIPQPPAPADEPQEQKS